MKLNYEISGTESAQGKLEGSNGESSAAAAVDAAEKSSKVFTQNLNFICEYIKNNGGHANLETMAVDKTVEGFQLLLKVQKQIRNQKNK